MMELTITHQIDVLHKLAVMWPDYYAARGVTT